MNALQRLRRFRDWVPVPARDGRPHLWRWLLLEGNRIAVTGAIVTVVFVSLMLVASVWPFEMQRLLTDTSTVENILGIFLSGIILLVSIVVSINSIVLARDMKSIETQEQRVSAVGQFWRDVDELTEATKSPSDLRSFLESVTTVINRNATKIADSTEEFDTDFDEAAHEYTESVRKTVDHLDEIDGKRGADFALLWTALEVDYGPLLDRTHVLRNRSVSDHPDVYDASLDRLVDAFELFTVGREYFKTMYYMTEISRLSRVLLIVSLPAILLTATAILAISAGLFPNYWVLGLPPLHSFVATTFTVALVPYIILTSFMLRLSTVASRSNTGGVFSMN